MVFGEDQPTGLTSETRHEAGCQARLLCDSKQWRFVATLGHGGTSSVFEVSTAAGHRALKIFYPRYLAGKEGEARRKRMLGLDRRLEGCNFPHLARIEEVALSGDTLYLLMRREQGRPLSELLDRVPRDRIGEIVRQVAAAAYHLERHGICHRDIKCNNILISGDFTRAVLIDIDPGFGQWRYRSPEYAFHLVKPGPKLSRGLTFYQLGALLHDLIMKRPLFEDVILRYRDDFMLPISHAIAARVPVVSSDSVPRELVLLARRALDKDLSRRLAMVSWADFLQLPAAAGRHLVTEENSA